ncbi:hypothetical protein ACFWOJ_24950 [Streptomyces sp. NPDC058439]|uniref:hypothetical protein n=1 Tax=Streptomyces sp. NPDC058439 TaxID=3346500 RepID=UPI00366265F4
MAEKITTIDQLKQQFAQYPQIGSLIKQIGDYLAQIDKINIDGGGKDDEIAKQYHETIDPGMTHLHDLLTLLKTLVEQVGYTGSDVMGLFDRVEDEARSLASSWSSDSA